MSTSRCGNICVIPPKCSRKERRRGFSNRSSVDEAMSGRRCLFLRESKSTLFGLPKAFYGRPFREPRRGGNSDFAMTIWRFWISDCKSHFVSQQTHFEVLGYFSQEIFQKQKVARMNLFVYMEAMWAFTFARASRGCLNLKGANGAWAWPY